MTEQFINSDSQPTGPDAVLASDHAIGDGVLNISGSCPPRILLQGPEFRVKVGHTLFKVTALGAGSVAWAVTVVENTADDAYVTGTPIYLEYTAGALVDSIFNKPFVFTSSEVAQYPNSSVLPTIPTTLAELTGDVDVTTTPPTDQQALLFDLTSGKWLPGDVVAGGGGGGGGGGILGSSSTRVNTTIPQNNNAIAYQISVTVAAGETVHVDALVSVLPTTFSMVTDIGAWLQRDATVISPKHSTSTDQYRAMYNLGWSDTPGAGTFLYKLYVEETANRDILNVLDNGYIQITSLGSGAAAITGVRVTRVSGDVTLSGATVISFDSEVEDTDGFHDNVTNNTRLTVPTGKGGVYVISGGFYTDAGSDVAIRLNGTTEIAFGRTGPGASTLNAYIPATVYHLADGDYVELICTPQGATRVVFDAAHASPHFTMYRMA